MLKQFSYLSFFFKQIFHVSAIRRVSVFIWAFLMVVAFCSHPLPSYGAISKTVHIEWSYNTSLPGLAGYRIYQDGVRVAEIPYPATLAADITILLENSAAITMTAFDASGNESAPSDPFLVNLNLLDSVAPVAAISTDASSGESPLAVLFDAGDSYDADGVITNYSWDFGDGSTGSGDWISHTFVNAGNYNVTLTVTDDQGYSDTATVAISVSQGSDPNQPPTAEMVVDQSVGQAPFSVSFDGSWSDDPDGTIASYYWFYGDGQAESGATVSHTFTSPGNYTVSLTVTDNEGAQSSAAEKVISVTAPSSAPTIGALTPFSLESSPGAVQTFTATYSDPDGAQDLDGADFLVTTPSGVLKNSIFLHYSPASNTLSLYSDHLNAMTSCTPGTAVTLSNSQGSLNCAASSVVEAGTNLTMTLAITPSASFVSTAARSIRMRAIDGGGLNTRWTQEGSWTIHYLPPSIGSLTPASVGSQAGIMQTFVATYSDPDGTHDLDSVDFLVTTPSGVLRNSIFLHYTPASNTLTLYSDHLNAETSCTPGTAATLSNSQGSINCAASSVVEAGTNLTMTLAITPSSSFASTTARQIRMRAIDSVGLNTQWTQEGSWTIENLSPSIGSLTPASVDSQAGILQTFTATYSDTNGATDLDSVDFLVTTPSGVMRNSIFLHYSPASNTLTLYSDRLNAETSCTPGTAATLSNSQGSVNCAASSVVEAGTNLTMTLAITPDTSFASADGRIIWMRAIDSGGLNSRWTQEGSWLMQ